APYSASWIGMGFETMPNEIGLRASLGLVSAKTATIAAAGPSRNAKLLIASLLKRGSRKKRMHRNEDNRLRQEKKYARTQKMPEDTVLRSRRAAGQRRAEFGQQRGNLAVGLKRYPATRLRPWCLAW